jgi:hypothetical protein
MDNVQYRSLTNGIQPAMRLSMNYRILVLAVACCGILQGSEPDRSVQALIVRDIGQGPLRVEPGDSRATAVIFVSTVCPMAADYGQRLVKLRDDYSRQGVRMLLIDSNDNESDAEVEEWRTALGLPFLVYRDPHTQVAEALQVYSTPTAVVLDQTGAIRYWGSIDDARNPSRVDKPYLRLALDALLAGKAVERPRTRVLGCSIKRAAP